MSSAKLWLPSVGSGNSETLPQQILTCVHRRIRANRGERLTGRWGETLSSPLIASWEHGPIAPHVRRPRRRHEQRNRPLGRRDAVKFGRGVSDVGVLELNETIRVSHDAADRYERSLQIGSRFNGVGAVRRREALNNEVAVRQVRRVGDLERRAAARWNRVDSDRS
jgi:hypothetical protein